LLPVSCFKVQSCNRFQNIAIISVIPDMVRGLYARSGSGAGALGAGAVGVGGCAWLRWPVTGLQCVSSARLRCARALWAVAGRPPGSDLFPSGVGGGGRAVAGAGGARFVVPAFCAACRRGEASRSRGLFFARRRRRVRRRGASGEFWAKCSAQDVAPVTPIGRNGEHQSLYFAHAMCTDRDLVAGVARTRMPYAENMVSGFGCACGAGPGAAEAAAGLAGMRCEEWGNFD